MAPGLPAPGPPRRAVRRASRRGRIPGGPGPPPGGSRSSPKELLLAKTNNASSRWAPDFGRAPSPARARAPPYKAGRHTTPRKPSIPAQTQHTPTHRGGGTQTEASTEGSALRPTTDPPPHREGRSRTDRGGRWSMRRRARVDPAAHPRERNEEWN